MLFYHCRKHVTEAFAMLWQFRQVWLRKQMINFVERVREQFISYKWEEPDYKDRTKDRVAAARVVNL